MTPPITRPRRSGVLLTLVLAAAAVMAVACGGSSKSGTTNSAATPAAATTPATPTTPASSTTSAAPPGLDNLTGTYSGHQTGAYNGTLTIIWQESGWKQTGTGTWHANLNGTIKLSNPAGTESVQGTWHVACPTAPCNNGGAIQFRTMSGTPILYTGVWGSSNGSAVSGSYRAAKGRGSFSALQVGAP